MNNEHVVRCVYVRRKGDWHLEKRIIDADKKDKKELKWRLRTLGKRTDRFFGLPHVDKKKVYKALKALKLSRGSIIEKDGKSRCSFTIVLRRRTAERVSMRKLKDSGEPELPADFITK